MDTLVHAGYSAFANGGNYENAICGSIGPARGSGTRAAAIQTLHAQAAPKAYVVAQNVVKDEAGYMRDFAPSMSKAIETAGGKYLVRGGKTISIHGAAPASRVVILQFDSVDKAQAWANAEATKALFAAGEKYATLSDYIVEGVAQ